MAKKGKVLQTIISIAGEISPTLGKSLDGVIDKLDGVDAKALAVGASVAAIAGAAAIGVGKATKYLAELGEGYDKAADSMAASTGLVGDELDSLESTMQAVYGNNFGDDMEDVADSVAEIYRQTRILGDDLQDVTEAGFALRDTFGYDIPESARAAKAIMTNFGKDGKTAMGLIAAGAQNGLDYSGELLDSISEYSVQFAKLGFTADQMFSVFQQGADSGAWNLDKVGDAVKEFSIRSIDSSKTTIHAFESLGLNADEMMGIFAAGGEDASIAFQGVLAALMGMDDQVQRDLIGVELFGTQWEDLGTEAMTALLEMQDGAYDAGDALGKINAVKYDNLGSTIKGIKRQVEVSLLPAAGEVQQAFMDVAPEIEELIIVAEPVFTGMAECIGPLLSATIDFAQDGVGFLAENMDILLPLVAGLTGSLTAYKAITLLTAAAESIKSGAFLASIPAMGGATAATTALGAATAFLTSPIFLAVAAIGALIAIGVALYQNWDTVKEYAAMLGESLDNTWDKITTGVGNFLTGIKDGFFNTFSSLAGIVKAPINSVIGIVNGAIDGVNEMGFEIPEWVPILGGKKFDLDIPNLPLLYAGGFTRGVSIAGEAGTEAVISFDPAYRAANLSYWAEAGRMLGADSSDFSLDGEGGGVYYDLSGMSYSPQVIIHGNADKQDVLDALEEERADFFDMLDEWWRGKGDPAYD